MISTNWSIPDSPGNSGCPSINSAITQPVDQMSKIVGQLIVSKKRSAAPTDVGHVVRSTKDQLWSSVVSRADIADVGLSSNEDLGRTEITQLQDTGRRVEQKVLGFDVPVTYSDRVNVGERS